METKSCKSYRDLAWNTLSSRWGEVAMVMLIIVLCACIGSGIAICGEIGKIAFLSMFGTGASFVLTVLLVAPLMFSFQQMLLSYVRQVPVEEGGMVALWKGFGRHYSDYVVTSFLMYVVMLGIGIITLGIGAVIFGLAYSIVPFVMQDNPDLSATEVLHKSRMLMRGHKCDLLLLMLSFIGWFFVGMITMGVGFLWVGPYWNTAIAHFYEDVKGE